MINGYNQDALFVYHIFLTVYKWSSFSAAKSASCQQYY